MNILFKNKWLINNFTIDNKIKKAIINDEINIDNIVLILEVKNNNFLEYVYNNCDIPKLILEFIKINFYFNNNYFLEKDLNNEFKKLSILIDKLIKNVYLFINVFYMKYLILIIVKNLF